MRLRERESYNLKTIEPKTKLAQKPKKQKIAPNNRLFDVDYDAIKILTKKHSNNCRGDAICDPIVPKHTKKLMSNVPTSNFQPPTSSTAITLVALAITIIVLLILVGVTLTALIGKNGIIGKAKIAKEQQQKTSAEEIMNVKITACQMKEYSEKQRLPNLQILGEELGKDKEISYVAQKSKKIANANSNTCEIENWEDVDKIYTKLEKYPYEFEITSNLRISKIDGVEIEKEVADTGNTNIETRLSNLETKLAQQEKTINSLNSTLNSLGTYKTSDSIKQKILNAGVNNKICSVNIEKGTWLIFLHIKISNANKDVPIFPSIWPENKENVNFFDNSDGCYYGTSIFGYTGSTDLTMNRYIVTEGEATINGGAWTSIEGLDVSHAKITAVKIK